MDYQERFQRAADDQGFEEPLKESNIGVPEGWTGGRVEQTGGFILCRLWYDEKSKECTPRNRFEVGYGSDPGVSVNRYEYHEEDGYYAFAGVEVNRPVDENTDERKAEVAKELMEEFDPDEFDRSDVRPDYFTVEYDGNVTVNVRLREVESAEFPGEEFTSRKDKAERVAREKLTEFFGGSPEDIDIESGTCKGVRERHND